MQVTTLDPEHPSDAAAVRKLLRANCGVLAGQLCAVPECDINPATIGSCRWE